MFGECYESCLEFSAQFQTGLEDKSIFTPFAAIPIHGSSFIRHSPKTIIPCLYGARKIESVDILLFRLLANEARVTMSCLPCQPWEQDGCCLAWISPLLI